MNEERKNDQIYREESRRTSYIFGETLISYQRGDINESGKVYK